MTDFRVSHLTERIQTNTPVPVTGPETQPQRETATEHTNVRDSVQSATFSMPATLERRAVALRQQAADISILRDMADVGSTALRAVQQALDGMEEALFAVADGVADGDAQTLYTTHVQQLTTLAETTVHGESVLVSATWGQKNSLVSAEGVARAADRSMELTDFGEALFSLRDPATWVRTHVVGFNDAGYDEAYAAYMANSANPPRAYGADVPRASAQLAVSLETIRALRARAHTVVGEYDRAHLALQRDAASLEAQADTLDAAVVATSTALTAAQPAFSEHSTAPVDIERTVQALAVRSSVVQAKG